jgi:hypothetical protein
LEIVLGVIALRGSNPLSSAIHQRKRRSPAVKGDRRFLLPVSVVLGARAHFPSYVRTCPSTCFSVKVVLVGDNEERRGWKTT